MKKKISLVLAFVSLMFCVNAQVFDCTTGTDGAGSLGAPGTNDGIWLYEGPGGGGFIPVPISTGVLQSGGGTLYPNTYVHNSCGQWISPWINGANNIVSGPGTAGIFTYKMTFNIDVCDPTAVLDLGFMAADNLLTAVRVNGDPQTIPGGISFPSSSSMTSTPTVVMGTNTIEIDVNNAGSYTALQLCGNITVSGISLEVPTGLGCCDVEAGEMLSWLPVAGATGYEVWITLNDPDCCPEGLPAEYMISTADNFAFYASGASCYSWKVRAIFSSDCASEFSEKQCGCNTCDPPTGLECGIEGNQMVLTWAAIGGAVGYDVEIIWNDPACCPHAGFPYMNIYHVTGPEYILNIDGVCFSWKVRTHCANGTVSEWSGIQCSCEGSGKKTGSVTPSESIEGHEVIFTKDPNPASDFVTITIENPTESLTSDRCKLVVFDLNGEVVMESDIRLNEAKKINVSALKSGMYICNILSGDRVVATDKLLIQK